MRELLYKICLLWLLLTTTMVAAAKNRRTVSDDHQGFSDNGPGGIPASTAIAQIQELNTYLNSLEALLAQTEQEKISPEDNHSFQQTLDKIVNSPTLGGTQKLSQGNIEDLRVLAGEKKKVDDRFTNLCVTPQNKSPLRIAACETLRKKGLFNHPEKNQKSRNQEPTKAHGSHRHSHHPAKKRGR